MCMFDCISHYIACVHNLIAQMLVCFSNCRRHALTAQWLCAPEVNFLIPTPGCVVRVLTRAIILKEFAQKPAEVRIICHFLCLHLLPK